jgi:DNA ligase-1
MGADGTEFNEASGQVRQKSGTASGLVLNVFDCIARGEWAAKRTRTFKERRADLQRVLEFCIADSRSCVRVVPQTVVNSPSGAELFAARDAFMEQGFEGAMAKRLDASYNFKRSSDLLKIKSFLDADGVVVGVVEGRGKFKGMLGALVVDFDGVTTEVGSGFTDEQRRMLLANSQGILNKHVEVKFQNRTPDGKLRFPVFCRTRPDKD